MLELKDVQRTTAAAASVNMPCADCDGNAASSTLVVSSGGEDEQRDHDGVSAGQETRCRHPLSVLIDGGGGALSDDAAAVSIKRKNIEEQQGKHHPVVARKKRLYVRKKKKGDEPSPPAVLSAGLALEHPSHKHSFAVDENKTNPLPILITAQLILTPKMCESLKYYSI